MGKKYEAAAAKVDRTKRYSVDDAVALLKETVALRATRFDQTVNIAINLGVDPKHADQMVRGAVVLPNGYRSPAGTSTSITFTGRLFGETSVRAVAEAYQKATDFNRRRPSLEASLQARRKEEQEKDE